MARQWSYDALNARYVFCLVIALASGAAALTHELLWTRRLVDILGATGEATSLVLGCFFLGLSLGAAIASRRVGHLSNPWKALALVELIIAVLTVPAAVLPHITEWIWPALGPEALISWPGRCLKLTIGGLVVVPPATAMGMTLPILIVAIQKTVASSRTAEVLVYAFNTLGGAFGLLVTSVWLLPAFGVFGCMLVAMVTNVIVAGTAWSMHLGLHPLPGRGAKRPNAAQRPRTPFSPTKGGSPSPPTRGLSSWRWRLSLSFLCQGFLNHVGHQVPLRLPQVQLNNRSTRNSIGSLGPRKSVMHL